MIIVIIILVAIIAAGMGAVGGVVLDRATRPAVAASPTGPLTQKMICPYDGLEVDGNNELDVAVHMQCIRMQHFILEQEVEKRATELAQQKVKALPPPPTWEVKVTNNDVAGDYPFRWPVFRDGVKRDTGTSRSEGRAQREGDARKLDLQRQEH